MGSLVVFVVFVTIFVHAHAAPVTESSGLSQANDGEQNVEEMERFHRTYNNGTVEFKMALSNGHVQYQRISSKDLDGDKIQVYEGYISEQYEDGRYGTRYYAADENGYRSSPVIIEDQPPKLPSSGPYAISRPRDNQKKQEEQSSAKTITDNLIELENELQKELLTNVNLVSDISKEISKESTEQGGIIQSNTKTLADNLIELEKELEQEQLGNLNLVNDIAKGIASSTSEFKESSESPLVESNQVSDEQVTSTQASIEETSADDKFIESSDSHNIIPYHPVEEDLAGRSIHSASDILSEGNENVNEPNEESIVPSVDIVPNLEISTEPSTEKSAETTETVLYDEISSKPSTEVPEINEIKTDGETSSVAIYPIENTDTESTTLPIVDIVSNNNSDEEEILNSTEVPDDTLTERSSTEVPKIDEVKKTDVETTSEPYVEGSTDLSIDQVSETTTETFSLEDDTLTEKPASLDNTKQETSSEIFSPNEAIEGQISTGHPLEEVLNDENSSRSLGASTDLPVFENNSTNSITEASGNSEEENISNTLTNSESNEETTNKIETNTEQEEVIATTYTTITSEIPSTTEKHIEISTEQSSVHSDVSSETNSISFSTELPEESSEETDRTVNINEITTTIEPEVTSTTEEETTSHGVEVELYHPVFRF